MSGPLILSESTVNRQVEKRSNTPQDLRRNSLVAVTSSLVKNLDGIIHFFKKNFLRSNGDSLNFKTTWTYCGNETGCDRVFNEQCSKSKVKRESTRQKQSKHGPLFFVVIGTSIIYFFGMIDMQYVIGQLFKCNAKILINMINRIYPISLFITVIARLENILLLEGEMYFWLFGYHYYVKKNRWIFNIM